MNSEKQICNRDIMKQFSYLAKAKGMREITLLRKGFFPVIGFFFLSKKSSVFVTNVCKSFDHFLVM